MKRSKVITLVLMLALILAICAGCTATYTDPNNPDATPVRLDAAEELGKIGKTVIELLGFGEISGFGTPGYVTMFVFRTVINANTWYWGVLLVLVYLELFYLFTKKLGGKLKALRSSKSAECGFKIFPFWHWLFYVAAALVIPMSWPIIAMIPLIAIPQLYLLIRRPSQYPSLLLLHVVRLVYTFIAIYVFSVVACVIAVFAVVGGAMTGVGGDKKKCKHCDTVYDYHRNSCPKCGN